MSPMRPNKQCMKVCSIILLMAATSSASIINGNNNPISFVRPNNMMRNNEANIASILEIRGGATRKRGGKSASLSSLDAKKRVKKTASGSTKVGKQPEKESPLNNTMQKYKAILPMTRLYITLVGISTLLGVILGEEAGQVILGLDPIRFIYGLEMWRPITAASFLGPPSIGWLMSAYYLFEYGSSLERVYGTSQQLIFLITQVGILSMTAILFGQPFFGQSVITSMLHVLSRSMPHQKVKWLIFTVPYWTLPYGLMASDVLQGGAAAALPHVLGVLSGHCYYFHKFVWPKMGGEDWLVAPDFLVRRLEPDSAANNAGRKSIETALKKRKKGKGRKLGA
uniref:Derlin n=1 Tax=Chaetoceros debilis TaxID=122233 RepID=A0A7S3PV39_9STRA|mmetsp:Transcript_9829/g.14761  ORF Transcript_9829/g.14761 Transcript_9829/m.14761 type:complete len:339 (+) Transcript_9829:116-1132(+)